MRVDLYLSLHKSEEDWSTEEEAYGPGWVHFFKSINLPITPIVGWEITCKDVDDCFAPRVDRVQIDESGLIRAYLTLPGFTSDRERPINLKRRGWKEVEFWDYQYYDTPEMVERNLR